jgi:glutamate racemase
MIGIFDSGVGGLTVLHAIRQNLPSADVLYFGDTKNAPYGEKTRAELSDLTVAAIQLLQSRGANNIVSACNSVSASLAISLLDAFDLQPGQLIEMVGPTVSSLRKTDMRIGLCATPATIHSELYQNAFRMVGKDVVAIPMPGLAGAIEVGKPTDVIDEIIRENLRIVDTDSFDMLVLACTHYPFVENSFRKILGERIAIFDPALAVADRVERQFWPREVGDGSTKFIISAESTHFRDLLTAFFPDVKYEVEVLE